MRILRMTPPLDGLGDELGEQERYAIALTKAIEFRPGNNVTRQALKSVGADGFQDLLIT